MNATDDKSTLAQVMAWCRQAPSHYLSQCWPRSLSPYGVTRPQWVNRMNDQAKSWEITSQNDIMTVNTKQRFLKKKLANKNLTHSDTYSKKNFCFLLDGGWILVILPNMVTHRSPTSLTNAISLNVRGPIHLAVSVNQTKYKWLLELKQTYEIFLIDRGDLTLFSAWIILVC